MPSDAFEELAKGIMTSNSCLKGSLPAIATSLRALQAILPGQETAAHVRPQPRRQSAMPTADAMRRAADLLEAGGRHMPAFESQVCCIVYIWYEARKVSMYWPLHSLDKGRKRVFLCKSGCAL